ncbi:23S rRNA (adenine(2503)-C(2))-methyltransferase RlmN [uncultured Muribaculum sp.]|uniref:23S rRNA (adenine(2503)-C(2))-methyltransferase RlmN n=1 Tax=uncultured Muribaculum sp. TaxID=1918613 RepID=UPI0025919924|nr:23S rRNA (adenine(2503)-C(2))-methyltransferase RlmN [uncultured Muribaculum sp.]
MEEKDKKPLVGMTLDDFAAVAEECRLPRFAAKQIADWIYVKRVDSIDAMTNLSIKGREQLKSRYRIGLVAPKESARSKDGTVKYLFDGRGGRDIEAVYIPDRDRATLCVSSQAGCRMGCRFCMTGRQGFHGNLDAYDILNQILAIPESLSLTNIVFMGMGEPMDNLPAVLKAIEILTAPWGLAWSPKRITVSSIGKLDSLKELLDKTKVHVAISVHSPVAVQRESLMPVEKAYPLKSVIELLRGYDFSKQRRLSVEYIMWRGVNDNLRSAQSLARLLKGLDCRVNLIRFHAIPDTPLETADDATMVAFRDRLNELGITATIRTSRGEDIAAACGMLAGKNNDAAI